VCLRLPYLIRLVRALRESGLDDPVVMRLRALPFVLVAAAAVPPAAAQQGVCYPVQPGDTAARFALRLTGSADNVYAPWFHVVDTRARNVPKSQYADIHPGWRVCLAGRTTRATSAAIGAPSAAIGPRPAAIGATSAAIAVAQYRPLVDPMILRYGAAGLILVSAVLAFLVALQIVGEREVIRNRMKAFGERFVGEFEAPLFQYPVRRPSLGHPVRSRLRFSPHRRRMEILLAPLDGRSYPNLSDHRKNFEYDIERVLQLLGDERFRTGRLRMEGRWVVIPFTLDRAPGGGAGAPSGSEAWQAVGVGPHGKY
jgi:hypothetical protein